MITIVLFAVVAAFIAGVMTGIAMTVTHLALKAVKQEER